MTTLTAGLPANISLRLAFNPRAIDSLHTTARQLLLCVLLLAVTHLCGQQYANPDAPEIWGTLQKLAAFALGLQVFYAVFSFFFEKVISFLQDDRS